VIGADFAVRRIGLLATLAGPVPRTGSAMRDIRAVPDAALAASLGRIAWVGPDAGFDAAVTLVPGATVLDAGGAAVVPGLVDPHTHLAFAGDRDQEIRRRLAGASYQEIAAEGGGIVRTVEATRSASREELAALVAARLDEMVLCGTTTAEVKSGYGLETAAEVRSLEAIRLAASRHPVTVVPTFLGAHEIPREHRDDRARYVDLLVHQMIPAVAERGLAVFADVFCEEGVFTVEESRRILLAARERGMKLRIHADELAATGGAELAGALGARSADHLVHVSPRGIAALAAARCVATLLPSAAFYLRLGRFAPARALVEAGAPVALATDVNPGGGLSPALPFAMAIGCFAMGLSLEEALAAVTINAAFSLDLDGEAGSIEPGKRADLVLLTADPLRDIRNTRTVETVVASGRVYDSRKLWVMAGFKP
jgi:imidazolonepropionase